MTKLTIYKYSRYGDHGDLHIEYADNKKCFLDQQKDDLKQGFSIDDDTIEKITFNADDLKSLCDALNN